MGFVEIYSTSPAKSQSTEDKTDLTNNPFYSAWRRQFPEGFSDYHLMTNLPCSVYCMYRELYVYVCWFQGLWWRLSVEDGSMKRLDEKVCLCLRIFCLNMTPMSMHNSGMLFPRYLWCSRWPNDIFLNRVVLKRAPGSEGGNDGCA